VIVWTKAPVSCTAVGNVRSFSKDNTFSFTNRNRYADKRGDCASGSSEV